MRRCRGCLRTCLQGGIWRGFLRRRSLRLCAEAMERSSFDEEKGSGWRNLPLGVRVLIAVGLSMVPLVIGYVIAHNDNSCVNTTDAQCGIGAYVSFTTGLVCSLVLLIVSVT